MATVEVSAGPIEYTDTGGDGRVLVLLHGLAMDGRLWDGVVATLGDEWRFVMPTLPFGAHRVPMHRTPTCRCAASGESSPSCSSASTCAT